MTDSKNGETAQGAPEEQSQGDDLARPRPFSTSAEQLSSLPTDNCPYRSWWVLDPEQ